MVHTPSITYNFHFLYVQYQPANEELFDFKNHKYVNTKIRLIHLIH